MKHFGWMRCFAVRCMAVAGGLVLFGILLAFFSGYARAAEDEREGDFSYTVENGGAVVTRYHGSLTRVEIPEKLGGKTVTVIDDSAFFYRSDLTSIRIPDSVTRIGKRAFECCTGLTSITIPDSVTSIEVGAFDGCSNLIVYCPAGSAAEAYAKEHCIPYRLVP